MMTRLFENLVKDILEVNNRNMDPESNLRIQEILVKYSNEYIAFRGEIIANELSAKTDYSRLRGDFDL